MTRLLLASGVIAVLPWTVLHLLGARSTTSVIAGMPPLDWGGVAWILGPSYLLTWFVAVIAGPPLLGAGLFSWLRGR